MSVAVLSASLSTADPRAAARQYMSFETMDTSIMLALLVICLFAAIRLAGWCRYALGAGAGVCAGLAALLMGLGRDVTPHLVGGLAAGVGLTWILAGGRTWLTDTYWPLLRPHLAPDTWADGIARTTTRTEEWMRWETALRVIAGSVGAGLLAGAIADDSLWSGVSVSDVLAQTASIAVTVVIAFLLLEPMVRRALPEEPAEAQAAAVPGRVPWRVAVLAVLAVAFLQEAVEDLITHGLSRPGGALTLFFNSLVPGPVTYYWIAAAQRRVPSIPRRAARAAAAFGAAFVFTFAVPLIVLAGIGGLAAAGYAGGVILVVESAAQVLVIGVVFGIVMFGLPAFTGALALRWLTPLGLAWRAAVGLLPWAAAGVTVQWLLTSIYDIPATDVDWIGYPAQLAGWVAGLWISGPALRVVIEPTPSEPEVGGGGAPGDPATTGHA